VVDADTKYLHTCSNDGTCTIPTLTSATVYYLSGVGNSQKIIKCTTNQIKDCEILSSPGDGYYINAGTDKSVNPLIYCKNNVCKAVAKQSGYYINGDHEKSTKQIIKCKEATCESESVTKTKCGFNSSEKSKQGQLIIDNEKVKVCVADWEAQEIINSSTALPVYKSLSVVDSDDFPNVSSGKIDIKFTNDGRVYKLETIGDDDKLPVNNDASCTEGIYKIKSDNKIYYGNPGTTCKEIVSTEAGLPENSNDGGYVYFDKDYKIVNITEHPELVYMAYYCTFSSGAVQSCEIKTNAYFYDAATSRQKGVYCSGWKGEGCTIVNTMGSSCSSGDEGKIVKDSSGKISICFGSTSVAFPESGSQHVMFKTIDSNQYYGKNKDEFVSLLISGKIAIVESAPASGYHINRSIKSGKKYLINCASDDYSSCMEETAFKGYYVNSSGDNTKPIIKCTSETSCDPAATSEKCTAGNIYKSGSDYYLCKTTSNDAVTPENEIKFEDTSYHTLTIDTANAFPSINAAKTDINVKVTAKYVVLMEDDTLPECPSNIPSSGVCVTGAEAGQHCIHSSTNKIYMTTKDGNCSPIAGTSSLEYFFFDGNAKLIEMLSNDSSEARLYECIYETTGTGYTLKSCALFKGYIVSTSKAEGKVINCSGWKGEGCILDDMPTGISNTCTSQPGKFVNSYKLCIGSNDIALGNKRAIVTFPDTNTVFGVGNNEVVFLSITKRTVKVTGTIPITETLTDTNVKYYVSVTGTNNSGILLKCNSTACKKLAEADVSVVPNKNTYLDANNPYSVIQCTAGYSCTSISGSMEKGHAYIDAGSKTNTKYTNVITCNYETGCVSTVAKTDGHVYIDATQTGFTNIIKCNSEGCESVAGSTTAGHVYIDATIPENVIQCTSGNCISQEGSFKAGYAYIDSAQVVSETKYRSIITCQTGTCVSTTKSVGSTINFIDGTEIKNIITCTGTGDDFNCTSTNKCDGITDTFSHDLYADGTALGSNTIYCFKNIGCMSITTITQCDDTIPTTGFCNYLNANGQSTELPQNYYCWHKNGKLYVSTQENNVKSCTVSDATTKTILLERNSSSGHYSKGEIGSASGGFLMECNANNCELYLSTNKLIKVKNTNFIYHIDEIANSSIVNKIKKAGYYVGGKQNTKSKFDVSYSELIYCEDTEFSNCKVIPSSDILTSAPEKHTFYIDRGNDGHVINCNNSECISEVVEKSKASFLDEEQVVYPDIENSPTKKHYQFVITCNKGECTSENKTLKMTNEDISYFIDGFTTANIIRCSYDETDTKIICSSVAHKNGKFIDGTDNNKIISCSTSCYSLNECQVTTGVYCKNKTYYRVNKNNNSYILKNNGSLLYYCVSNAGMASGIKCSKVTDSGYYININEEKAFSISNGVCTDESIGQCFDANDIGKLFIDNNLRISLCLNYGTNIMFAPLNSQVKNYLLKYKSEQNIYKLSANEFALIRSNENSFTQDTTYNYTNNYFTYINPKTSEVLVENGCPDQCFDDPSNILIEEYECEDGEPVCTKVTQSI